MRLKLCCILTWFILHVGSRSIPPFFGFLNKEFCKSDTNFWVEVAPTKCRNVKFLHHVSAKKCVNRGQVDLISALILKHLKHQNFLDIPRVSCPVFERHDHISPPPPKKNPLKLKEQSLYTFTPSSS